MRLPITALLLAACAHDPVPVRRDDAPPKPLQPARLMVRDVRPKSDGPELRDSVRDWVTAELEELGVPLRPDAKLSMEIDVISIATTWGAGSPRSCVKLLGRVLRDGQEFVAAADVPSERCTSDERYAAFKDLSVLRDLGNPRSANKPTPEAQLIVEALRPLIVRLSQRCR